jgi:hypothetical protein
MKGPVTYFNDAWSPLVVPALIRGTVMTGRDVGQRGVRIKNDVTE